MIQYPLEHKPIVSHSAEFVKTERKILLEKSMGEQQKATKVCPDITIDALNDTIFEIVAMFEQLDPESQDNILELVRRMVDEKYKNETQIRE